MSTEPQPPESSFPPPLPAETPGSLPEFLFHPFVRPKFQHRYRRHILFFLLTLFTTSYAACFVPAFIALFHGVNPLPLFGWTFLQYGLWYSIPLLTILSAHEFGHYFACRHHNVDATLPYYLPAPGLLTGTLGAVIRIREAFPSKRALFDIGVAGPLAGFVALLPFLYWGITRSKLTPLPTDGGAVYFGEPLLWKLFQWIHFGRLPDGMELGIDQVGFAAWWGMLATALNLLPFGQLDGGHIMYANVGRRATRLSVATLVLVFALTLRSPSWMSMAVMLTVMAFFFGFRHPRIVDEHEPLDPTRRVVSLIAVMVFILCFTPVPIDIIGTP